MDSHIYKSLIQRIIFLDRIITERGMEIIKLTIILNEGNNRLTEDRNCDILSLASQKDNILLLFHFYLSFL